MAMRLLLVGALAALAVALPTRYHRKPSANERSEHFRAAARWLIMEKSARLRAAPRDACADLYDSELNMRTFKDGLESYWGWKSEVVPKSANEVALSPHKFEEYCRELNELKDQARRLVKEKIAELKLEIERKEQELEHFEEKGWLGSKNLKERAVDEQLRQLLKKPKPKPGSVSSYYQY